MDRRWIHPLFKPSRKTSRDVCMFVGRGNFISGNRHSSELIAYVPFSRAVTPLAFGQFSEGAAGVSSAAKRLAIFVTAAALAVIFSVSAIVLKTKFTYAPRIAGLDLSEFKLNHADLGKEAFLARLSAENKREMMKQVHYVSQLITNPKLSQKEINKIANAIVFESARNGYDPLFVTAVIKSESTFNRHAVSYAGAMGLMQIMPATGRFVSNLHNMEWKGAQRLRDADYNLKLGIAYLKHLEEAFQGNKELMLIAYNWGPKNVLDALRNEKRIPASCIKYAKTILNNHNRWNAQLAGKMPQMSAANNQYVG